MHPTQPDPVIAAVEPTVADILRGAAAYLKRYGWIQNRYYAELGPRDTDTSFPDMLAACAVGAIGMAAYGTPTISPFDADLPGRHDFVRAVDLLIDSVHAEYGDDYGDNTVFSWNDWPSRTADEVTTALEDVANEWDRLHTGGAR